MSSTNAPDAAAVDAAIQQARRYSLYLDRLLTAAPRRLDDIDLAAPCEVSAPALRVEDKTALYQALRRFRQRTLAALMVRDLAGWAELAEVTTVMTRLAEAAIRQALDWISADMAQTAGTPRNARGEAQQLIVLGMGKLGGGELNVSSDIDLIFVYPEEGESDGARALSNHEYFSRMGRALIAALSQITEDGFVFRVDMRLRPYGDSGPLAMSFDMLENYLITQGREWERYAWIKARALTGGAADITTLMSMVRPFIYRRHLDYSAFASMRDMHQQIRREVERRDRANDIKLGRGGIREIEFIAQLFQLIRGGREAGLRREPTLEVLALLPERNLLPAPIVEDLARAYDFLRRLEHRLQYLDDQQTHVVPLDAHVRAKLAESLGFDTTAAFEAALERHRNNVSRQFDALFADARSEEHALAPLWTQSIGAAAAAEKLGELGFARPAELQTRLAQLRDSPRYRQMPASSQSRLDRLAPFAIEAAAAGENRDATLERLLQFLESVNRRESYLALLEEYPQSRRNLAELMRASPWVAQYLTLHPILLDELLDARALRSAPDWRALAQQLRATLDDAAGDAEKQMDALRHFKHAQTLRLVAQDLAGNLPLETLADHLSDLACVVLGETLHHVWQGVHGRHRETPAFAVIGYGKLGGKELGYASDLDLVFLFDDEAPEAPQNYARLAQRMNTWLNSTTAAGLLYDTDLRLRPDGAAGLTVSPFAAFRDYQLQHAWVWEHQALSRARFVAGDAAIGARFESLRNGILRLPRELNKLRAEVAAMRQKMHEGHPNKSGLFDIKHDHGGIADIEFIVQYLVLGHARDYAALTGNIGNLALLKLAAQLNLIAKAPALAAHAAYRELRRLQHALRLQGDGYARVPHETVSGHVDAVRALWQQVMQT
ncbi:MAG: bifunctional [glutamate--ammonia ligase]-adenylyl-L-tyrosine phosphorylase/[glutamate--ammonia-ligase] adenylyltransferase [Betaproteobacteria bacterium]|nr:bifunctional [glutamate--ammonia ligase]-adenylyl-L-tyrosine phosphorylase/[glutamate--ammonia-ligase] adenylyltransferase [Betaproteobacteria bacterium]